MQKVHLHEHPWQTLLKPLHEMRRHLGDRHDIGDSDLLTLSNAKACAGAESRAGRSPCFAAHLVIIAEDAIDLDHPCEHLRLGLRRAAGHDDPRLRPLAFQPADRLPRLRHSFAGDRAAIDDDCFRQSGAFGLAGDHFGFEGVEAATEGDDFDAHYLSYGRKQRGIEATFILKGRRARHQDVVVRLAPLD